MELSVTTLLSLLTIVSSVKGQTTRPPVTGTPAFTTTLPPGTLYLTTCVPPTTPCCPLLPPPAAPVLSPGLLRAQATLGDKIIATVTNCTKALGPGPGNANFLLNMDMPRSAAQKCAVLCMMNTTQLVNPDQSLNLTSVEPLLNMMTNNDLLASRTIRNDMTTCLSSYPNVTMPGTDAVCEAASKTQICAMRSLVKNKMLPPLVINSQFPVGPTPGPGIPVVTTSTKTPPGRRR